MDISGEGCAVNEPVYWHGKAGPPQHEGDNVKAEQVAQSEERLGPGGKAHWGVGLPVGKSTGSRLSHLLRFILTSTADGILRAGQKLHRQ